MSSEGGGQRVDFDLWRFADHEGYEQNWAISKGGTGSIYFILYSLEAMSTVNLPHPQKGRRGRGSVAIIEDYRIPVHLHLTSESCHGSPTVVYNLHMIFNNLFLPVIIC